MKFLIAMLSIWASLTLIAAPALSAPPQPLPATAPCEKDSSFDKWVNGVKAEAMSMGVSKQTFAAALPYIVSNPKILAADRNQGVFQQSFLQFSERTVSASRLNKSQQTIKKYQALFQDIEKKYGVPAQVLVTYWAMESDFGVGTGSSSVLTSVTTLAYDCRRAPMFRRELLDALRVIERGDQTVEQLKGGWAGELGGLQISPSDAFNYGVDEDGDGRIDVINSIPDMLATAANFLSQLGWIRGQPWLQEVRVPMQMPWDQADLAIDQPRSQWLKWGVSATSGPLVNDSLPASLWLPMGRLGPAFLVYSNFKKAYLGWNSALVYSTSAAYFATRLLGAPKVSAGNGTVTPLTTPEVFELQQLLVRHGFLVGVPDGRVGSTTRIGVKKAQMKLGLPADSYPTTELIERLRSFRG